MPGPPPPPPPMPQMGGPPPPPPPIGGLSGGPPVFSPNARAALLDSISSIDPNKPRLKKVDPTQIKDRSKPTVPGSTIANNLSSSFGDTSTSTPKSK